MLGLDILGQALMEELHFLEAQLIASKTNCYSLQIWTLPSSHKPGKIFQVNWELEGWAGLCQQAARFKSGL